MKKVNKIFMFKIIIYVFISLIFQIQSYTSQNPLWVRNNYFRSSNGVIINNNINSAKLTSLTFTFSSSLTGLPYIAIGYKCHQGYDYYLNFQNFQLRVGSVTASTLILQFQLYNNMRVYRIEVSYFVTDPSLPYHINVFNNVHLNYSSGPLTTFNTRRIFRVTHTQNINYTSQASNRKFNKFALPIRQNNIALFQNSIYVTSGTSNALMLHATYSIINQTHYQLRLNVDYDANVYRFTFSIIIYNQDNVLSSKEFSIYSQWLQIANNNYRQVNINFRDNLMSGLLQFTSASGTVASNCGIQYYWTYQTNARPGVPHQIYFQTSSTLSSTGANALSLIRNHLFYIKTWSCNTSPFNYYNTTTQKCQDGCSDYFVQNITVKFCDQCYYSCQKCSLSLSKDSCTVCQNGTNRKLNNGSCTCIEGYFDDYYDPFCRLCTTIDPHCLKCQHNYIQGIDYKFYFSTTTWKRDIFQAFNCTLCMANYFLNQTTNLCEACNLFNCTVCLNFTACSICNSTALTIKYTDNKCYVCNISRCTLCQSNNVCTKCQAGYDLISNQCLTCNQSCVCGGYKLPKTNGKCDIICGDGLKIENQQCDDANNFSHDGCSNLCKIETCSQNCSCGGWVAPWITKNNSCSTLCGDGIKIGIQQCDDGNNDSHDGCSLTCKNQPCQKNCHCKGWSLPFIVEMDRCTPICGDGLILGDEQCDDNNTKNNDKCDSKCRNQKIYLKQQSTTDISLIIFFLSFRIVGIQVLNVIQHFQLFLKSHKIISFQISYFIHGYSNSQKCLFQVSKDNQLLKQFNIMFLIIFLVFFLLVLIQFIDFMCKFKFRTQKSNSKKQSKNNNNKQNNNLSTFNLMNQVQANKLLKTNNEIKIKQNQKQKMNKNKNKQFQKIFNFFKIFLRQILFDLIINCISIFLFKFINQIINNNLNALLQPASFLIIIGMFLLILGVLILSYSNNIIFSQNQLKFNKNKIINYWMIIIFQKIIFSVLLNFKQEWSLYAMIGVKLFTTLILLAGDVFVSIVQKIRNLVVNLIHLILISTFTIKQITLQSEIDYLIFVKNNAQYIYWICIISLLVIMIIFYIRQAIHSCSADQRSIQQDEEQKQIINNMNKQDLRINLQTNNNLKMEDSFTTLIKHQDSNITLNNTKEIVNQTINEIQDNRSNQNILKNNNLQANNKQTNIKNNQQLNQLNSQINQEKNQEKKLNQIIRSKLQDIRNKLNYPNINKSKIEKQLKQQQQNQNQNQDQNKNKNKNQDQDYTKAIKQNKNQSLNQAQVLNQNYVQTQESQKIDKNKIQSVFQDQVEQIQIQNYSQTQNMKEKLKNNQSSQNDFASAPKVLKHFLKSSRRVKKEQNKQNQAQSQFDFKITNYQTLLRSKQKK